MSVKSATKETTQSNPIDSADSSDTVSLFSKDNIGTDNVLTHVKSFDGGIVDITGDVDEAMEYAVEAEQEAVQISPEEERKLLWKIDLFLLPLICLLYAIQFMDKVSTGYAAVMGLRKYYHMHGNQYSWCGSAFYLGYLIFEFPMSLALQKFPVSKFVSVNVILWGLIICLHSTPSNYAGFITLRTLLGVFESAVTPAMVIITGQWYKAEEQFLRTAIWFSCNGLGVIMGSSIAYGLAIRPNSYSMENWKVLFIVIGCMTIAVGFMFLLHIPDLPVKSWFLKPYQRKQVVLRIKSNQQGFGNRTFKVHQFKEAMLDINTWIFFFFSIAFQIPNGALTNFAAILLSETFGYTPTKALLMNMIAGAVVFGGCIFFSWTQRFFKHKLAIATGIVTFSLIASCMLAFPMQSPHARLAGYYLYNLCPVGMICCLSCFTSNVAGHTKKITVNALYLIGYSVGNLIGPQTFIASQAPKYRGGQIAMVVSLAVSTVLISWIYYNYWSENKRRDRLLAEGKLNIPHIENFEFADLTDKENVLFRYTL
jgi:ACS family allantoate permease-like MFS transporter